MGKSTHYLVTTVVIVLLFCIGDGVWAFGAGNIPDWAYMEGRAFRHGDIEDVIQEIAKKAGGFLGRGTKFGGLDIKRIYFGNWLRDYSQAVDIAGLKKLPLQTIINLCMALGFLAHGYATGEFEVTAQRLGVYLPTEHIDNPKGYGEGEDARQYHPDLRPPIDPKELDIDPKTGMKNYIANENGTWDTSKALVRRTLINCIETGRRFRATGRKEDEYEAFRLLGQSLHTLEDFPAHSNFCELALVSLGHTQVFSHVGDQVRIKAPNGRMVAPIVTGTFGSSDFIFSLMGEATDHISEASVSDLTKAMNNARSQQSRSLGGDNSTILRELIFQVPGMGGSELSREMEGVERLSRTGQPGAGGKKPEDMTPEELHAILWQILTFRDNIMRAIETTIEKIPGLSALVTKLTNSIQVFIFTTIEPFMKPILQSASKQLAQQSAEVINNHDQYEVFNDPIASDPTHSFLSKDHFALILNEPAGRVAKIVVHYVASMVVKAWGDDSPAGPVVEDVLGCLFHPEFHDQSSRIQREMLQYMATWANSHGNQQRDVMNKLSKQAVRDHQNTRVKEGGVENQYVGGAGHNLGVAAQSEISGYVHQIPGVNQAQHAWNAVSAPFQNQGPGMGFRREMDFSPPAGPPSGYPQPPSGSPQPPSGPPPPPGFSPPPPGAPPFANQSTRPGQLPPGAHPGSDSDSGESGSSKDGRYGYETKEQRRERRRARKHTRRAARAERRAGRHGHHGHGREAGDNKPTQQGPPSSGYSAPPGPPGPPPPNAPFPGSYGPGPGPQGPYGPPSGYAPPPPGPGSPYPPYGPPNNPYPSPGGPNYGPPPGPPGGYYGGSPAPYGAPPSAWGSPPPPQGPPYGSPPPPGPPPGQGPPYGYGPPSQNQNQNQNQWGGPRW